MIIVTRERGTNKKSEAMTYRPAFFLNDLYFSHTKEYDNTHSTIGAYTILLLN